MHSSLTLQYRPSPFGKVSNSPPAVTTCLTAATSRPRAWGSCNPRYSRMGVPSVSRSPIESRFPELVEGQMGRQINLGEIVRHRRATNSRLDDRQVEPS